jgi:hypothetical protein
VWLTPTVAGAPCPALAKGGCVGACASVDTRDSPIIEKATKIKATKNTGFIVVLLIINCFIINTTQKQHSPFVLITV